MKWRRIARVMLMGIAYAIAFIVAFEFIVWMLRSILFCMATMYERGPVGA